MLERATSHDNSNYIYCDAVGRSNYRCGDRTMKEILGKITQLTAHNGDVKSNLERVFGEKFITTRAERLQDVMCEASRVARMLEEFGEAFPQNEHIAEAQECAQELFRCLETYRRQLE